MTIREEELRAITPAAIIAFLLAEGWETQASAFKRGTVWINRERPEAGFLVLPMTSEVDDYPLRVETALRTLARTHGGTEATWRERLLGQAADTLNFDVSEPSDVAGTIAIARGISLFNGIRDALAAAVKASIEKAPYFGARHWPEAREFLETARFGQTRPGSYVVSVLAPALAEDSLRPDELLVGPGDIKALRQRRVTSTLMRALGAARQFLDTHGERIEPGDLQEFVDFGVSSDLLSAVAKITPSTEGGETVVTAQWSPLQSRDADVPDEVKFTWQERDWLDEADAQLREAEVIPEVAVAGYVESLKREADEAPGLVTVVATGGPVRRGAKVRMTLERDTYDLAIRAHQSKASIMVTGDMTKLRRRSWLRNVSEMIVVPDEGLPFR
jgi:hypothetical protein